MRRCRFTGSDWMLINIVAFSHDTLLEDVILEGPTPVAVYIERIARGITFRGVQSDDRIQPMRVAGGSEPHGILAARTYTGEWWDRDSNYGNQVVGPSRITWEDKADGTPCLIYCPPRNPIFGDNDPTAGIYMGPGIHTCKVLGHTVFFGPGDAILQPRVRAENGPPFEIGPNVVFANDGEAVRWHSLPMGT
jgi:hypothetical protein